MPKIPKISRRNFIRASLYGGVSIAGGVGYVQSDNIEVVETTMAIPHRQLDGLVIAVLADFHAGAFLSIDYLRHVITKVNSFKPDLICLVGDYVDDFISRSAKNLVDADFIFSLLSKLKAKQGVFAVLGNHDHWIDSGAVTKQLSNNGITVLNNRSQRLENNLVMAGVDDYWEGPAHLGQALAPARKEDFVVLLSHNPDINQEITDDDPVNLVLSGHTHGGQIRPPFYNSALWVPCSPRYKSRTGLIRESQKRYTFITKGVGTFFIPVRLNCPPDIGLIRFNAAATKPDKTKNS